MIIASIMSLIAKRNILLSPLTGGSNGPSMAHFNVEEHWVPYLILRTPRRKNILAPLEEIVEECPVSIKGKKKKKQKQKQNVQTKLHQGATLSAEVEDEDEDALYGIYEDSGESDESSDESSNVE